MKKCKNFFLFFIILISLVQIRADQNLVDDLKKLQQQLIILSGQLEKLPPPVDTKYRAQIDAIFNGYITSGIITKKNYETLNELFEKCGSNCQDPKYEYLFGRVSLDYFKKEYYDPIFKNAKQDDVLAFQKASKAIVENTESDSLQSLLKELLGAREIFIKNKAFYKDPGYENKNKLFDQIIVNMFDCALLSITNLFNEDGIYKGDGVIIQLFSKDQKDLFDYVVKFFKTVQSEKGNSLENTWAKKINDAVGKSPSKGGRLSPLEQANKKPESPKKEPEVPVKKEPQEKEQKIGNLEEKIVNALNEYNQNRTKFIANMAKVKETLENFKSLENVKKRIPKPWTDFKNELGKSIK